MGQVMLNVPAGSNAGTSLRLKGRGLLDRKSGQRGARQGRVSQRCLLRPVAELARGVVDGLRKRPEAAGVHFDVPDLPPCWADRDLVRDIEKALGP